MLPNRSHAGLLALVHLAVSCSVLAQAFDADVFLNVVSSPPAQMTTGALDHDTFEVVPNVDVFAWTMLDPFGLPSTTTGHPGFIAFRGSGLHTGANNQLGFRVLDGLRFWDGLGPPQFGPVPNGETIRFSFGASSIVIGDASGPDWFFGNQVPTSGAVHIHTFTEILSGPAETEPAPGVYVLRAEVLHGVAGVRSHIQPSEPLIWLFGTGVTAAQLQAAAGTAKSSLSDTTSPTLQAVYSRMIHN